MKKYAILILLLILIMPINVLTITNMYEDDIYVVRSFSENDTFIMKWIHSVELEPWEEWFTIKDKNIILIKTRFKAFGAGVPSSSGEQTYIEDDYVVFDKINTTIPNLTYGISPIAKHEIVIKNETISLYEIIPSNTGVSIDYKKMILIKYLILR